MRQLLTIITLIYTSMLIMIAVGHGVGASQDERDYLVFWQRDEQDIRQYLVDTGQLTSAMILHRNVHNVSFNASMCDALSITPKQDESAIKITYLIGRNGTVLNVLIPDLVGLATTELWSPQQRWIGIQTPNERVLLDVENRAIIPMLNRTNTYNISLDDTKLVQWNDDTLTISTLPEMLDVLDSSLNARMVRWSPDGQQIAVAGREVLDTERAGVQRLFIYDLQTGEREQLATLTVNSAIADWSPDGRFVPYSEIDGINRFMVIVDTYTGNLWRIPKAISGIFTPQWSMDSRWLAYVDKQGLLTLSDASLQRTYTQKQKALTVIGWLDDERLVYQSQSNEMHIARWHKETFSIQTRYPITARAGICRVNNQSNQGA